MHMTVGKYYWKGKEVYVECRKCGGLKQIDNKDENFFMIVLLDGNLSFRMGEVPYEAKAPCFLCFNERETPKFEKPGKTEYYSIYFHPVFLNINMTFKLIRSYNYEDIAQAHNLFLLKPFLENKYVVPMSDDFLEKMRSSCESLERETVKQPDWYWSCRCRSYFMEIMMVLERQNSLYEREETESNTIPFIASGKLQKAVEFIESHYSESITLNKIIEHCGLNHTTLTTLFKREKQMTVMKYLADYRIKAAKKHLAFTDLPLKEIANRCGFKTAAHFSRVFKEITNETPAAFRKAALEKRKKDL